MSRAFLLLLLLAPATADVSISRIVDSVAKGNSAVLTIASGCTGSDAHGSNDCTFKWGETISGTVKATLATALNSATTVNVDAKIDDFIPFKASCNLCGAPCTITIPVVKKTITIKVPPCPIKAGAFSKAFSVALPASNPVRVKTKVTAKVSLADDAGAELLQVTVTGTIDDSASGLLELTLAPTANKTLYKSSGGECGQATLDTKYATYAEKFAGLKVGTCAAQGFIVPDGEQTIKVPYLGDITYFKFKKAAASPAFALRGSALNEAPACGNDADKAAWAKHKPSFEGDMTKCGEKCLGGADCVTTCIQEADGYSSGCAACFGALAGCTKSHCMLKCMGGNSPACKACVAKAGCDADFASCSGIGDLHPAALH